MSKFKQHLALTPDLMLVVQQKLIQNHKMLVLLSTNPLKVHCSRKLIKRNADIHQWLPFIAPVHSDIGSFTLHYLDWKRASEPNTTKYQTHSQLHTQSHTGNEACKANPPVELTVYSSLCSTPLQPYNGQNVHCCIRSDNGDDVHQLHFPLIDTRTSTGCTH